MGLWDEITSAGNAFALTTKDLINQNQQYALEDRAYNAMREDTAYQRAVADLKAAGLNPWAAVSNPASSQPISNMSGSNAEAQKIKQSYYQLLEKTLNDAANTTIKGGSSIFDAVSKIGKMAIPIAQLF